MKKTKLTKIALITLQTFGLSTAFAAVNNESVVKADTQLFENVQTQKVSLNFSLLAQSFKFTKKLGGNLAEFKFSGKGITIGGSNDYVVNGYNTSTLYGMKYGSLDKVSQKIQTTDSPAEEKESKLVGLSFFEFEIGQTLNYQKNKLHTFAGVLAGLGTISSDVNSFSYKKIGLIAGASYQINKNFSPMAKIEKSRISFNDKENYSKSKSKKSGTSLMVGFSTTL